MTENTRKTVLIAEVDATGAKKGFEEVKQGARDMAQAVTKAGQDTAQGLSGVGATTEQLTVKQSRLIESIRRQAIVATEGKAAFLSQRAAMEGVSAQTEQYIAKLKQVEQGQEKLGVSAGQTAQAFRQLPAQMSDIAVQLAGGQNPFLILLQQGSQIKESFGGLGATFRALAGSITPATVAILGSAAALGALGIAVAQFESHQRTLATFNAQLAATGRASLLSSGELTDLVKQMSLLPGISKESAEKVVSEFTKAHTIGGGLLRDLTLLSADFARATGTDAPAAAKRLAEAFADPTKGAKDLEGALGTLKAAQLLQIEDLVKQNDLAGAQRVLYSALAGQIKGLANEAVTPLAEATNNLGNAWNQAIASFGKSDSLRVIDGLLVSIVESVGFLVKNIDKLGGLGTLGLTTVPGALPGVVGVAVGQAVRNQVFGPTNTGGASGSWTPDPGAIASSTEAIQANKKALEDQTKSLLAATTAHKSLKEQQAELAQTAANLRRQIGAVTEAGKKDADFAARNATVLQELRNRLAGVLESMQKKGATSFNDAVNAEIEALKRKGAIETEIGKRSIEQLQTRRALGEVNDRQLIEGSAAIELAAIERNKALMQAELVAAKTKKDSLKEQQTILGNIALAGEQYTSRQIALQDQLAIYDKKRADAANDVRLAQLQDDDAAHADEQRKRLDLLNRTGQAVNDYAVAIDRANEATAFELSLMGKTDMQRAIALAQFQTEIMRREQIRRLQQSGAGNDEILFQTPRINEAAAKQAAGDVSRAYLDEWKKTSDSINQSLTDALLRGFESGKSFAENFRDTLKNMFSTLILRPIIQATLAPVSGAVSGTINSALGLGNSGGGINSLGSIGSRVSDFFGFGGTAASTGVESLGFGAAELSGAGVTASSVGVGGGLASIGAAVPYVAAAFAAAQLLGLFDHGGPKVSGSAGTYPGSDPNSNALDGLASQNILGTKEEFKKLATTFGATAAQANAAAFGLYVSTDPQGKSATLLGSNATVNGKQVFDSFDTNVGRSQEELQAAFAAVATRQILAALKATQLDAATTAFLEPLDAAAGDIKDLTAALATLEKARTASNVLETLGVTLSNFTKLNIDGQAALLNVFGGAEAFQSAFASYQKSFYSADEQLAAQRVALQKEFDKLGIALPGTKEEFRALVSGLDITTDAGQQTLASLIKVSGAFAQVSDAAKSAADDAIAAAKASADANATVLKNATGTAFDILKASIAAQKQSVEDAFSAASTAAQGNIDRLTPAVDSLQSLSDSLRSTLNSMTLGGAVSDAQNRKDAQRQIADALGLAKSGKADQIDQAKLSTALATAAKPNQAQFSDFISYAKDYAKTAGDISMLAGVTDDQLSVQKRQLQTANDTLAQLKKQHDQDIAALTSIQDKAQAQVDAINGTTIAVKSVEDALKAFSTLVGVVTSTKPATTTTTTTSTTSTTSAAASFNPSLVQATWDANPQTFRDVYQSALGHGQSLALVDEIFKQAAGTAEAQAAKLGLPGFANGLLQVPYDNFTARLHKDELVMPARQATEFRELDFSKFHRNDAALVAEMRATREEIEKFRMKSEQQTREHLTEARKVSRVLVGAENTTGGGGLITVAAA